MPCSTLFSYTSYSQVEVSQSPGRTVETQTERLGHKVPDSDSQQILEVCISVQFVSDVDYVGSRSYLRNHYSRSRPLYLSKIITISMNSFLFKCLTPPPIAANLNHLNLVPFSLRTKIERKLSLAIVCCAPVLPFPPVTLDSHVPVKALFCCWS